MKTYLVRVVGSGWYLVREWSEESAMNAISYQKGLSRKTYTFSIEDLDIVLSKEYNGCAELSSKMCIRDRLYGTKTK